MELGLKYLPANISNMQPKKSVLQTKTPLHITFYRLQINLQGVARFDTPKCEANLLPAVLGIARAGSVLAWARPTFEASQIIPCHAGTRTCF